MNEQQDFEYIQNIPCSFDFSEGCIAIKENNVDYQTIFDYLRFIDLNIQWKERNLNKRLNKIEKLLDKLLDKSIK